MTPLRREQLLLLAVLLAITALSWWYLLMLASDMAAMDMDSPMVWLRMQQRGLPEIALLFAMWAVMMAAMMLPSAMPMMLLYYRVAVKAAAREQRVPSTLVFASGYLLVWTLFSIAATALQWGLERWSLMSPAMVATSPQLGAALLIAVGLYQFSPWKDVCLAHCRQPAHLLARRWRPGTGGALAMGVIHGAYCLGCCWGLMLLLFVGGVMNLLWVALIAVFVLVEKLTRFGRGAGLVSGVGLILAGVALEAGFLFG